MITTSENTDQLWPVVFTLQSEIPMIVRDKEADTGKFKFRYADLSKVWSDVQPKMHDAKLMPVQTRDGGDVVTRIIHVESGQWFEARAPFFITDGAAKDTYGSWTMARRHGLMTTLFVVAAGDDDDSRLVHESFRRSITGYRDDVLAYLVRSGKNMVEAQDAIDAKLGDRSDSDLSADEWREITKQIKEENENELGPDPLLEASASSNSKKGK